MSLEVFAGIPLFSSLDDDELAKMEELTEVRGGLKEQILFEAGDPTDGLYIISRGRIKITIPASGTVRTLSVFLGEGDFFGEMGVIQSAPRNAHAEVTEDAILLFIAKEKFDNLMAVDEGMSEKIMRTFNSRAKDLAPKKKKQKAGPNCDIIVLYSPAGGAGTTFLTCNLAKKVRAYTKKRVVVLDADFQLGTTHVMFNHPQKTEIGRLVKDAGGMDSLTMTSSTVDLGPDFNFVPAPANIEEADLFNHKVCTEIITELADINDYIMIDTPTHISESTLCFFEKATKIVVVLEPHLASTFRLASFFALCKKVNIKEDKMIIVINKADKFGYEANDISEHIKRDVFATVHSDREAVMGSINDGKLLVDLAPESIVGIDVSNLARKLVSSDMVEVQKKKSSFSLWNLFK